MVEKTTSAPPSVRERNAVLITGAAKRIGAALARDLGRAGFPVAVHYHRSQADAEVLVSEIVADGGDAVAVGADLASETEVAALVGSARDALGPLGCLINNASVFDGDTPETATRETWDRHMEVNLRAPFVLTQSFAAQVPETDAEDGSSACVINVIDQRVFNLTPYFTTYTLSKYALWGMTQTLARALAPRVRVNAIGPGPTLPSYRQSDEQFREQWLSTPLERAVSPAEICAAARFILDAPALTGQMIALDSGQHLGWAPPEGDAAIQE